LSTGIALLEPGQGEDEGHIVTRWRLRVNVEELDDPVLGMFSQEPALMDGVMVEAMEARENDPYRRIQSVGYDLQLDNWR
jgi:hypothetical protein